MFSPFIFPILYVSIMTVMSWSSAPLFQQEKPCTYAVESCQLTCTSVSIPASHFWQLYQLCTNHLVNSISRFPSLWHSPPGISVHPHTRAWNLLNENSKIENYAQKYSTIWHGMNMTGGHMLKMKFSTSMPDWQKHRLGMHNTIKTGNMAVKCRWLNAYKQNTTLKIKK